MDRYSLFKLDPRYLKCLASLSVILLLISLWCRDMSEANAHAWSGKAIVLFVTYEVRPKEIRGTLGLPSALLLRSLPNKPRSLKFLLKDPQGYSQLVQGLRRALHQNLPIKIDQRQAYPQLARIDLIFAQHKINDPKSDVSLSPDQESPEARDIRKIDDVIIESHQGAPEAAVVNFKIPIKSLPKEIRFLWRSTLWFTRQGRRHRRRKQINTRSVSGIIIDQEEITPINFTPLEPEVIWRSPQAFVPPRQISPKSNLSSKHNHQTKDVLQHFKSLHSQIYQAFDHQSDEEIYDALSASLEGKALDSVFTSTYRALILRDQGGARARVTHVIALSHQELKLSQSSPRLRRHIAHYKNLNRDTSNSEPQYILRYHWRVAGEVTHWGHTHRRVNDYTAIYVMSFTHEGWRITFVEPLNQKRRPELEGSL